MNPDSRVLACVDQSRFADCVADYAAWAARRLDAPLEFLHVLDRHPEIGTGEDHSGAIGIDAQENLLAQLSTRDEMRTRAARERGRVFLNRLRERALACGAGSVDVRQRHGELEETLVEQASDVRLLVLGRRGESAEATRRDLGRNVERVVRALHRPILAVPDGFREPARPLIAFDGGSVTRRGVERLAASALLRALPIRLLMSGKAGAEGSKSLGWAKRTLEAGGFEVESALVPGDAESVIARAIAEFDIDLLVMGAYTHSPLRSLLLGSRTSDLLRAASVATLLLR